MRKRNSFRGAFFRATFFRGTLACTVLTAALAAASVARVAAQTSAPEEKTEISALDGVIAELRELGTEVQSWSADIDSSMNMGGGTMRQTGSMQGKGDMFRGNFTMNIAGQEHTVKMTTDPEGIAWTEIDLGGTPMVTRGKAPQAAGSGASALGGPGMKPGIPEDPAGVLEEMRDVAVLDLTGIGRMDEAEVYLFEGPIRDTYVRMFDPDGRLRANGTPIERVEFALGRNDGFPRRMALTDAEGNAVMAMTYRNVKVNPELGDDAFVYTPPEGAQVMDADAVQP